MTRAWETIDTELVLDGAPWLRVWAETVRLPSGRVLRPFYRYQKTDFVALFVLDEGGHVLLQRRYRHGPRAVTLDVPAGYIEPGEDPLAAAARELREETGFEADTYTALGTFQTDGNGGGNLCHIFLVRGAREVGLPQEDDTEEAELLRMPIAEVRAALEEGGFRTLPAAATVSRGLLALTSTR